ncbi:hypothetical protein [Solibacillus isronensis]|uniref:hypothetical protein n=1 Tax=Solibacillus isronensis TaxID=412383 RepID=UPI0039A03042
MLQFDEEAIYKANTGDKDFFNTELRIDIKEEGSGIYDNMYDLIIYTDCFIDFHNIRSIVFCTEFMPCVDKKMGLFKSRDGLYQVRMTEQFIVNKQHVAFLKFTFLMDTKMYKAMKQFNLKKKEEAAMRQKEKDK